MFRVVDLFETNTFAAKLFGRYESKHKIKEEYGLFSKFTAYNTEEADHIKNTVLRGSPFSLTMPPLLRSSTECHPSHHFNKSLQAPLRMS